MKCYRNDCDGNLQEFDPVKVNLPIPGSELRIGGRNPSRSIEINLPMVFCDKCRRVYKPKDDSSEEEEKVPKSKEKERTPREEDIY